MSKHKNKVKHDIVEQDFQDDDIFDVLENGVTYVPEGHDGAQSLSMLEMVKIFLAAGNQQSMVAVELTKLALTKSNKELTEDDVLALFKKSARTILEASPVRKLWNDISEDISLH